MGKSTGFIEYRRSLPVLRTPASRLGDWDEFHDPLDGAELGRQAARCMNCGTPFCHVGEAINGTTHGCPLQNLIPEWNELVYNSDFDEAYSRLSATNNFPEFTGRVCPAPCESSCVLGISDDPVSIKEIELAIAERAFESGFIEPNTPNSRSGKKVAIVGSGPAGLACADELNRRGHHVTVFERDDRIGGLLVYGIPNMKLDKRVVERRIELLRSAGIDFRVNSEIGVNVSTRSLQRDFDSIVLCTGAPEPRDLDIHGRAATGIYFAMDFLRESTKHFLGNAGAGRTIDIANKNVVVIGGGDTGTDCVATALRLGCNSLVQLEIMSQPDHRVADHDHWLSRSREFKVDYGQEESIAHFGEDPREYCLMTRRFIADEGGKLTGVETVEVESKDGELREVPNTSRVRKADVVLLAMGFTGVEEGSLWPDLGVSLTEKDTVFVGDSKETDVPGIFAAGDCERGQSLVVWAIADGRHAADSVDRYLRRGIRI